MKRWIALTLALLMVASAPIPAFAEGADTSEITEQTAGAVESTPPVPDSTEEPSDDPEGALPPVIPEDSEQTQEPAQTGEPLPPEDNAPSEMPAATQTPLPSESPVPSETPAPTETPEPSPEPEGEIVLTSLSGPAMATGQVDLCIESAMDLGSFTPTFTATLTGPDHLSATALTVNVSGAAHSFMGLTPGEYTLSVAGQGFAAYTQSLAVAQSDCTVVRLTVGKREGYGDKHPGVLAVGDVTGDGALDGADADVLMQAIHAQSGDTLYDLNRDGAVTLADAETLAKAMQWLDIQSTLEHYVPASAVCAKASGDAVTGNPNSLFKDDGVAFIIGHQESEPISPKAPLAVEFEMADGATSDEIVFENTNITAGEIDVTYVDPALGEVTAVGVIAPAGTYAISLAATTGESKFTVPVEVDANGNMTVKLSGQVAVKRVALKITGTSGDGSLASISQVEFVNGMADRITEPETSMPENVAAAPGSREFTVTWGACTNITGYEVMVTQGDHTECFPLTGTTLTVTRFNNDEVVNGLTYSVSVRSVNGKWTSDWAGPVTVTPMPAGKPDKPDNVTAVGGYESVMVSWKKMKDTDSYNLYYKKEGMASYTSVKDIKDASFKITGLDSSTPTAYLVYVTGVNHFGESGPSLMARAVTATLNPPVMPKYNLINQTNNTPGSAHIVSVTCNAGASCVGNAQDAGGTAWCTVDGNAASYYERMTWDDGGFNNLGANVGLTYTFDGAYTMDTIAIMTVPGTSIGYAKVRWWDADGAEHLTAQGVVGVQSRKDANGIGYYFLRLPGPITATKLQIGLSRGWVLPNEMSVAETYFYKYDPLKEELMALYTDDLHTMLREDVTEQTLNDLQAKIEASVDQYGNVNPDKDLLLKELDTARQILAEMLTSRVTRIHDGITASGDDHGFGGLNAWQPLGVVAAEGETVVVYVGHGYKTTGTGTGLNLVVTQYHAESSALAVTAKQNLLVGRNEITIPQISSTTGVESGGALYIEYTGGAGSGDSYAVRVSGGVQVPVLDLYKITDPGARLERVSAYLAELSAFVTAMPQTHVEKHQGADAPRAVNCEYDEKNCILGSSDIMLDTMMLSIPAQQVLAGCGGSADKLLGSLDAMENMMGLFYQHKGLNASAPSPVDRIPNRHLNIRYMRMFSGAFMYASGNHIGIEYTETDDLAGCGGVLADGSGLWQSGNYFGWGIAHEIGHDINQGVYAIAEVTNNYFAVLAQAHDTNDSVRFQYPLVYEKVTSGVKGNAANVFTQLGMYWQLHLAYDRGYNYKTYADYTEQLNSLFWARVDTYARTPSKAPKPQGIALTLEGADRDQALMRLCCAAANRNILDFFQRWGKTPDETTTAYATQFDKETRAIYYVNDDARAYTLGTGGASDLAADGTTEAIGNVSAAVDANKANKVDIAIEGGGTVAPEAVLGYEIVRCTIAGGVTERKTVGFTTESTFSDVVSAMNNRAVWYEITLVDKYLNRSAVWSTDMVKITHEGDLDKSQWTVSVSGLKADPIPVQATDDDPDSFQQTPEMHDAGAYAADGDVGTVYVPTVETDGAYIELDFHAAQVIAGFRYTAGEGGTPIGGYTVQVRQNGEWSQVDAGSLGGTKTVYFSNADGKYVSTYSADALRLVLTGQTGTTVSVAELDVLGPTGDNVDFHRADGQSLVIGYLREDYTYDAQAGYKIPAGSLVFTGGYKGNAAYNVVELYDQNGNLVTGCHPQDGSRLAYQIILATDPGEGKIENVSNGIWIYWIEPEDMQENFTMPAKVRAELYRVNNAQNNEGERLVSDTLFVDVPMEPGNIELHAG